MKQLERLIIDQIQPWILFRPCDRIIFDDNIFDYLIDQKYPEMNQLRTVSSTIKFTLA
jgi:hypothetical protein